MLANFCDPATYFQFRSPEHRKVNYKKYYDGVLRAKNKKDIQFRALNEKIWYEAKRPYYRIYPSILKLFLGVKLDIPCIQVQPPIPTLIIQLPNSKVTEGDFILHNIIVNKIKKKECDVPHTVLNFYYECKGDHTCEQVIAPGFQDLTMEFIITQSNELAKLGLPTMPPELVAKAIRFYATLCLIHDDPELVSPDVLNEDKEKYEKTLDPKYIKKAKNRGKWGYNIGKDIEMSPHYRNGCLALYWTGEGKRIPKIRWRTGCVVHREEVLAIPQGYIDEK